MVLNVALCLPWEGLHSPSSHLRDVESLTANEEWSKVIAEYLSLIQICYYQFSLLIVVVFPLRELSTQEVLPSSLSVKHVYKIQA